LVTFAPTTGKWYLSIATEKPMWQKGTKF